LRGFVEDVEEGALEVDVAEKTNDEDCGESDEGDDEERGWVGQETFDEMGDETQDENVREVDGVRPVSDGFEGREITDDLGAFEFQGSEEEENGEGSVEGDALPRVVDDHDWCVMEDDCNEQNEGGGEEEDSGCGMQAGAAVDVKEDVSSEELEDGRADEELNHEYWRDADMELQRDDSDAPKSEEPGGDAFGYEKEESDGEVEVDLEAEGPALKERHGQASWDEEIGRQEIQGALASAACQWREMIRKERKGVVDPEDGEDAGEAVIQEDGGILGAPEFSCGDGGDDDAADDEEDIHADIAVAEEAKVLGGEVSYFDAVQVGQYDEESGESATDLDADDSAGLFLRHL
jgi:hypothetical protein